MLQCLLMQYTTDVNNRNQKYADGGLSPTHPLPREIP